MIAGSKGVCCRQDRSEQKAADAGVELFRRPDTASGLMDTTTETVAEYSRKCKRRNRAGTIGPRRPITDSLWSKGVPEFTVLWLKEPDLTQHETGPGVGAIAGGNYEGG